MAVSPGATTVKARFRTIRALNATAAPFFGTLQIGVPNGVLVTYDSATSKNAVASLQPDPIGPLPDSSTYGYRGACYRGALPAVPPCPPCVQRRACAVRARDFLSAWCVPEIS
jgi:hypothetical protein